MPASLGDQQALTRLGQVTDHFLSRGVDHRSADRHRQYQVLALGTRTIGAAALLAIGRQEAPGIAVVHQGVEVLVGLDIHRAAITAVTTIGAALLDELLTTEAHHAVTAVAGLYIDRYFIDEFHGYASRNAAGQQNLKTRLLPDDPAPEARQPG